MSDSSAPTIVAADVVRGNVLIHFSNGVAVHYQAPFLWDIRANDGNVAMLEEAIGDEPLILPD